MKLLNCTKVERKNEHDVMIERMLTFGVAADLRRYSHGVRAKH